MLYGLIITVHNRVCRWDTKIWICESVEEFAFY